MSTKRINIQMSDKIVDFYQSMADEMGVSRAYCMVMALKHYMDQQQALVFGSNMGEWFEQMQKLAETVKENEKLDVIE